MTDHVDNLKVFHGMHEAVQQDGRASDDESKDETNNPKLNPSRFQCIICYLRGLIDIDKHMRRKHGFVKVKHSIKQEQSEDNNVVLQNQMTEGQMYKCIPCGFKASEIKDLQIHEKTHKKLYSCPHCDYVARRKQLLESHIINHVEVDEFGVFSCIFCKDFTSILKGDIFKHMALKHTTSVIIYECENCSYATRYLPHLKRHWKVHRNPNRYCCNICGFQTCFEKTFLHHCNKHIKQAEGSEMEQLLVEEEEKQKKTESTVILQDELQDEITEKQIYKCIQCDFEASEFSALETHNTIHKDLYSCPHCDYVAGTKQLLEPHITNHVKVDELGVFSCTFCKDFTSILKGAIFKHMALKHKNSAKIYECENCSYATPYSRHLKNHRKVHRNLNRYCCNICGFKTCFEKIFQLHCNKHIKQAEGSEMEQLLVEEEKKQKKIESTVQGGITEKQIYKCIQCDFEASEFSALETHKIIHEHSYSCPHCDHVAPRKDLLDAHIINHLKADELGVFSCIFCKDFTGKKKGAIFKHMAFKHKDVAKIYECKDCSYATPFLAQLNFHQRVREHRDRYKDLPKYCCYICGFDTYCESALRDHFDKHIKLAERSEEKQCVDDTC